MMYELSNTAGFFQKIKKRILRDRIIYLMCFSLFYKELLFDINILNHISKKDPLIDILIFLLLFFILDMFFKNKGQEISYFIRDFASKFQ